MRFISLYKQNENLKYGVSRVLEVLFYKADTEQYQYGKLGLH